MFDSNTPGKLIKIAELDSNKNLKIISKAKYESFIQKANPYKSPIQLDFDPQKAYDLASANKVYQENYIGGGAYGNAFKIKGKPPGIVKEGNIGQYEVVALQKLDQSGVTPRYFGGKFTTPLQESFEQEFVLQRKGIIGMSKAPGQSLDDIWTSQKWDDLSFNVQAKKSEELATSYIQARKKMHLKGIAHNDLHEANFMYDFKSKKGTIIDLGLAQDDPRAALFEALGAVNGNDSSGYDILDQLVGESTKGKAGIYRANAARVQKKLEKMGFNPDDDWTGWMSNSSIDLYSETNLTPDGETLKLTNADALKFLEEIYKGV